MKLKKFALCSSAALLFFGSAVSAQKTEVQSILKDITFIEGYAFNMGAVDNDAERLSKMADNDSFLLFSAHTRRVTVSSFYTSAKEVSNAEYRAFVTWVRDSVAHALLGHLYDVPSGGKRIDWEQELDWSVGGHLDIMFLSGAEQLGGRRELDTRRLVYTPLNKEAIRIYPDTLCWVRDFPYTQDESMQKQYFQNPVYDNYPVVGVNFKQALVHHYLNLSYNCSASQQAEVKTVHSKGE